MVMSQRCYEVIPPTPNKRECLYVYINYNFWQRLTKVPQLRIELSCDARRLYFLIQFNERKKKKMREYRTQGLEWEAVLSVGQHTFV